MEKISKSNDLYALVEAMNGAESGSPCTCGGWEVSIEGGKMKVTGPVTRPTAKDAQEIAAIMFWAEGHESAVQARRSRALA